MPVIAPNMSGDECQILFEFLQEQIKNPFNMEWSTHERYTIMRKEGPVHINLNYTFVRGERAINKPGVLCYILAQRPFSRGGCGSVFLASTVIIHPDKLVFKEKGFVIKQIRFVQGYGSENLDKEYQVMERIDELGVKPPTILLHKKRAYLPMKKLSGIEVYGLQEYEAKKGQWINFPNRLLLCIEILKTVKKKFADQGIVHGDLSNANILVLFQKNRFKISIIDFGKSFFIQNEQDKGNISKKDILELSILFREIWPSILFPYLPKMIKKELPEVLTLMEEAKKAPITFERLIALFVSIYASFGEARNSYTFREGFIQPDELESLTMHHFSKKITPKEQTPLSQGQSFFTLLNEPTSQSQPLPIKRNSPRSFTPSPSNRNSTVPQLQLPFFITQRSNEYARTQLESLSEGRSINPLNTPKQTSTEGPLFSQVSSNSI